MKLIVILLILSFSVIALGFFRQCKRSDKCNQEKENKGLICCTCDSHDCKNHDDCDKVLNLTCDSGKCQAPPNEQHSFRKSRSSDYTTILSDFCNSDSDCIEESHCRDNKCTHNLVRKRDTCMPLKNLNCICVCVGVPPLFEQCKKLLPKCNVDEDCPLHSFCLDNKSENGQRRCTPIIPRPTKPN